MMYPCVGMPRLVFGAVQIPADMSGPTNLANSVDGNPHTEFPLR